MHAFEIPQFMETIERSVEVVRDIKQFALYGFCRESCACVWQRARDVNIFSISCLLMMWEMMRSQLAQIYACHCSDPFYCLCAKDVAVAVELEWKLLGRLQYVIVTVQLSCADNADKCIVTGEKLWCDNEIKIAADNCGDSVQTQLKAVK